MWVIKKLGSLSFTVFICILLIVLLIISTTMESLMGTEFAQRNVYQTSWFDFILALFWINIFCSTVLRFPFKRRHTGFIITHISILVLLIGAMISRNWGIEGQMLLFEGNTAKHITGYGHYLSVKYPDGKRVEMPLRRSHVELPRQDGESLIKIGRVFEHAAEEEIIEEAVHIHNQNHAIKVALKSEMMDLEESFWLVERHPFNPNGNVFMMGPAHFVLKKGVMEKEIENPTLEFIDGGDLLLSLDLRKDTPASVPVGEKGLSVENIRYYERAMVAGRALKEGTQEHGYNPAVEFDLVDKEGNTQHIIKFALFPEFESMHGAQSKAASDLTINFQAPDDLLRSDGQTSVLSFYFWPDGHWSYKAISKDGSIQEGNFKKGEIIELDWVDMAFEVQELLDAAVVNTKIIEDPKGKGPFAVEVLVDNGARTHTQWLVSTQPIGFNAPEGVYKFTLNKDTHELPFALTLDDFRKVDYPGTESPASYESDVTLWDGQEDVTISETISMNEPLDYKGYRIFQTSYIQDEQKGEASVFTVAKNPGIALIYLSSFTLFAGAYVQFYGKKNGEKNKKDEKNA